LNLTKEKLPEGKALANLEINVIQAQFRHNHSWRVTRRTARCAMIERPDSAILLLGISEG
jgi:hypothetical protein